MNYRHLFHAGNFADMLKHALLGAQLAALTAEREPLEVLDTHAGAGVYDLADPAARRTGEAGRGVGRLMQDPAPPAALARLREAVVRLNAAGSGELRLYPGSPRLALDALRAGDGWTGCELRPDEARALRASLRPPSGVRAQVREGDGYAAAAEPAPRRRLVLIDPPFERGDEPDRIVQAVAAALRSPRTCLGVWLPIKDLDGYDRLLSRIEALRPPPSVAVQARLHPLTDPMRMNGAAMWLIGGPDLRQAGAEVAGWVVDRCGGPGGEARVERFGG